MNKMATLLVAEIDKTANEQAREVIVSTMNECSKQMTDLATKEENIRNQDVSMIEIELVGDSDAVKGESNMTWLVIQKPKKANQFQFQRQLKISIGYSETQRESCQITQRWYIGMHCVMRRSRNET